MLDPNTSDCFFDDHETKLGPKKSAKPATNFLSSLSEDQSEYVKQFNYIAL